jgi:N-methylhydantoinase B
MPGHDGLSARHSHMTNTLNTPVEVLERHYPLRILRYAIRRGSGGAGRWRGGDGIVREYEFLEDADLAILSERRTRGPWGLDGGEPGAPGRNSLDGENLPGKVELEVKAGQVLTIETPGGGGYGIPGGRETSGVLS